MTIQLTYAEALADLEAIVGEKGEGYVYEQPFGVEVCVYFHAGAPSCGVGHVLARHGITLEEDSYPNRFGVSMLLELGILVVDEAADLLLTEFQHRQDNGKPWGDALAGAKEYAQRQGYPYIHVDYPHEPGYLHDCPACEAVCHCTPDSADCVYEGEHNGSAS